MGRNTDYPRLPGFTALRGWATGGDAGTYARAQNIITCTEVGVHECLDVNVAGGGVVPVYQDDTGDFVIGTSEGVAIMAVYTTDVVDAGDIGVLSMTADRRLRVDAVFGGVVNLQSEYIDDTVFGVEEDYGQAVGGIYTADQINAGDFGVFKINQYREQAIYISRAGWEVSVRPAWMPVSEDETAIPLAVSAANYGYYGAAAVNSRMRPLIMDLDDGSIAQDQTPQLVIPLNYYYNTNFSDWQRWQGAGAPEVNANITAMPVVDIQSPLNTGFKSFDHPDHEINRLVWQDPPYKDGNKNDTLPPVCKWHLNMMTPDFASYDQATLYGPYEGFYCINLYEVNAAAATLAYNNVPFFPLGMPWEDRPGYYHNKVAVLEGRFHVRADTYDPDVFYDFGFWFYDGNNRNCFMCDVHQVAGVWDVYRGTADGAHIQVGNVNISEDGWNYFKLEVYPFQYYGGMTFKSITINGVSYNISAFGGYSVASAIPTSMEIRIGGNMAPLSENCLWDEITFWTYYEEYEEA